MKQGEGGDPGGSGYTAVELIKILLRAPRRGDRATTSRQDEHIAEPSPVAARTARPAVSAVDAEVAESKRVWRSPSLPAARHQHGRASRRCCAATFA